MTYLEFFGVNLGDGYVYIFPPMNDRNNIKHHIVAWKV